VIGVLLFAEPFTAERSVGYGLTWLALVLFTLDGLQQQSRGLHAEIEPSTNLGL
jgi:EamA domain-containing membrane protein RarD